MSVINQMLKDLDQRSSECNQAPAAATAATTHKLSILTIIGLTVMVLLSVSALGFYIWHLQTQIANNAKISTKTVLSPAQAAPLSSSAQLQPKAQVNSQPSDTALAAPKPVLSNPVLSKPTPPLLKQQIPATQQASNNIVNSATVKVDKIAKTKITPPQTTVSSATKPVTKMSVSRRQLTSAELVEQKLTKAEKAININEITKAEQLFEEVLIIAPENKLARKKLAALWFGRKSYQQAINLLSQGIAIDNEDGELRLLKARILFNQGQYEGAYQTLSALASFKHEDYQVMLANIAQQLEQYTGAINAYQQLIKMQPNSGRWYLGLAIVYDKSSQFLLAKKAYAKALTQTNLSAASAKFATQRMRVLGE